MPKPIIDTSKTTYRGSAQFGYTAENGPYRCNVVRVKGGGWQASYYGHPVIHNPWYKGPGQGPSRSCSCPVATLKGSFRTRKEAAQNGLDLVAREDMLNMRGEYAQARQEVAEQATVQSNAPWGCTVALGYEDPQDLSNAYIGM